VLEATRRCGWALAALGRAAQVEVEIEAHRALGRSLEQVCAPQEAAWKPSGAGGGDLALVFTSDGAVLDRAVAHLEGAGYPCIPLV
jgi:thiamine monophosphate kinase